MLNKFLKQIISNKIILVIILAICFSLPYKTYAASLSLLPSSSTATVGNIVAIKVSVNTDNVSINNAEASIQFPTDLLDVVSITKNNSIFSLWVEEPSYSNSTGLITFNGGVPTPGFNGQTGYIATITFRAKKQGTASVLFTDGAVRANDGLGTNVLIFKNTSVIKIENLKVEPPTLKPETPKTTTSDKNAVPSMPFSPSIVIIGNRNVIKFDDGDTISDIDYYTVQIDDNPNFKIKKDELINNEYYLPIQNAGSHTITIVAFGKTGNYVQSTSTFISPAISAPILSLGSNEITTGEPAIILGRTDYPNEQVNVFLEFEGKQIGKYSQTTGNDGSFSITTDKIKSAGIVSIWAETVLSDTIKSGVSEKIYEKVNETAVVRTTLSIIYPLFGLILVSILFIILLISLYAGWHKYFGLKRKINKELDHTEEEVHKAMLLLKDELNSQLESLEKTKKERNLNDKEEKIFGEIKDNVDNIDDFIEKKLKKLI